MQQRDMQMHITVLGWLYVIGHALFLIVGAFIFMLLTGIGLASGDMEARWVLMVVGTSVGALLMVLALPGLAAGYGLLTGRSWARVLSIVIGILNLINFPIGTIIGAYACWVLLQEPAREYFERRAVAAV